MPTSLTTSQNGNVQPTIAISADSSAPSTGSAIPSPSRSADPPHTASNGSKPDAESYATASKSMFDFVSPFDVFEKPKPKPKVTEKTHIEIEAAKANISKPDSPALSNATAPSVPARAETRERHLSGAGPQGSSRDLGLPWLASKLIPKGTEGKGYVVCPDELMIVRNPPVRMLPWTLPSSASMVWSTFPAQCRSCQLLSSKRSTSRFRGGDPSALLRHGSRTP